jgi:hypothetical protein
MSRSRLWFAAPCGAIAILVLLAAGCGGSDTTTVTGTVAYQGKSVPGGTVILYCQDKQIVHGLIGPDGRYTISNVPRGTAVITVQTQPAKPYGIKRRVDLPPSVNGPTPPPGDPGAERRVPIPPRYALPEESGLSVTVEGKVLTHDIELRP